MRKFIGVCLAIGLICLASGVLLRGASAAPSNYRIKGRSVSDFVAALSHLRMFMSPKLNQDQRCKRQAVVLSVVKEAPTNQFEIADIALGREQDIEKKYNQINTVTLRNLYIDASRQYLERELVDSSLIDVLRCLKAGFHNRDAKARSFLNQKELGTIIGQFEAISEEPLQVLIDGDGAGAGLKLREFHESVKNSIRKWLAHDEEKLKKLFEERQPGPNQPVQAYDATMDDLDREYLETVFGSLMAIYELLPQQAELGDRCHAYNRVIQAEREQIFLDEFVQTLVEEASESIIKQGLRKDDLMPDKKLREDFLFIVQTFNPLRAGQEVWLDLNKCLSKWVNQDENVLRYLQDPYHTALVNQVIAQLDKGGAQAYAGSHAGAVVQH